jgi:5,6,7,8-tetrahydromethanopterin hydro-lyase
MFGPAQAAVARAVVDSVKEGIIPRDKVEDYCILVGVFIHWDAKDDQKIYDYNYTATKQSIQRALSHKPSIDDVLKDEAAARHPFAAGAEGK